MADGNLELVRAVDSLLDDEEVTVLMAFKVSKSQAAKTLAGRRGRVTSKPRVLAVSAKRSSTTQKFKISIHVLKQISQGLELVKTSKLNQLTRIEAVSSDTTGRSFVLVFEHHRTGHFEHLKGQAAVAQWTTRSIDDRNELLMALLKLSKDNLGRSPKVQGFDVVEMALWAQAHAKELPIGGPAGPAGGPGLSEERAGAADVTVQQDLVSKIEEEDMEALLGSYVMGIDEAEAFSERLKRELAALEAANVHAILSSEPLVDEVVQKLDAAASHVDDMDEWLQIFNLKLRHMREDIEQIEVRNNRLEVQARNNGALLVELDRLLKNLIVPPSHASLLMGGPLDESSVQQNADACHWLGAAVAQVDSLSSDQEYSQMRIVREKRVELDRLKSTYTRRATDFLRNHFSNVVESMIGSRRGGQMAPDHRPLRQRFVPYSPLVQELKILDYPSILQLRKDYCHALNLLLRRELREYAGELKVNTKVPKMTGGAWMEVSSNSGGMSGGMQPSLAINSVLGSADTSTISDAYARMLRTFIPFLANETLFFAHFMKFDAVPPIPLDLLGEDAERVGPDDALYNRSGDAKDAVDTKALNAALDDLLQGVGEDFQALADWACKIDPLRAVTLLGITENFLAKFANDRTSYLSRLLQELHNRIAQHFKKFVDETVVQIEKHDRGIKHVGVLAYIPKFAALATRMEGLIQGTSREVVDAAYGRLVGTMFTILERIAQVDPKTADVLLLENFAAFQNSMYDLAHTVPTLARYYNQASEAYENACSSYVMQVIFSVPQFEKIFQHQQRVESLLLTITPEEVPFQPGFSKADLRKLLKTNLVGVEKLLLSMYKRMQKYTSEELLSSMWDKCRDKFIDKYENMEAVLGRCYPTEGLSPSTAEMRELFKTV
eukprot:SM000233S07977  [mRNA]  locus=s233:85191:92159:+ [translate_table: standard]